ncbi:UDP-N-acetylmuramoyl-L-alanine--D-glutamate ligase [Desulfonema magnum]|uniref:UDP-N-acetylmuramoylalanine--D-glutamate ligase n=1 Tax=Desulfonema magnum TaxID=45655 RepID=A0A975GK22_9BACT|nr:UDP-N-acetylmuramoyl-L-alanine--D-glutamate ligase [Desulfonema magnum]QTA84060.1 UDP-N-acetylmuramoylalanine--D-glutamate ligase [Desulfonema magnum]
MKITNKNILVVGLGMSGAAVACFLKNRGAFVTVTDMATENHLSSYMPVMREMGIPMELGQHGKETFEHADVIVVSPGVPHTIPPIKAAQKKGIPVIGEIELASRFIREPIVAITGTNGKTTTTTLLGKMLEASGLNVFVGGNIGNPLISYADGNKKADIVVAEISSFQLDTIDTFRPKASVLLNITEDHLDRYPDFKAYAMSKGRIFENQQKDDFAILNSSDPLISSVTQNIKSRKLETGNWKLETGNLKSETGGKFQISNFKFQISNFKFQISDHNMENISAACLAAMAVGGTEAGIQSALNEFKGLPHRIEYVATINDVRYFDDSKATNTDAVVKAVECFNEPVILIMGGRNKGSNFHLMREQVRGHAKHLIVMGEAKEDIKSALGDVTFTTTASSVEDAVSQAYQAANPGDVVLLSPACSSFDMYKSYAERGEFFCQAVREVAKGRGARGEE